MFAWSQAGPQRELSIIACLFWQCCQNRLLLVRGEGVYIIIFLVYRLFLASIVPPSHAVFVQQLVFHRIFQGRPQAALNIGQPLVARRLITPQLRQPCLDGRPLEFA
ncbi:hypothetical protein AS148_06420 [Achromobacter xylosoxidans]|nr:hypothetical protein AS148_06420 [Achromobacter xylosoxidans]